MASDLSGAGTDPMASAHRDILGETFARQELKRSVHRELLRMTRGDLPADDHLATFFSDDQIADTPVRQLTNLRLDLLRQARPDVRSIQDHGAALEEMQNKAALEEPALYLVVRQCHFMLPPVVENASERKTISW